MVAVVAASRAEGLLLAEFLFGSRAWEKRSLGSLISPWSTENWHAVQDVQVAQQRFFGRWPAWIAYGCTP